MAFEATSGTVQLIGFTAIIFYVVFFAGLFVLLSKAQCDQLWPSIVDYLFTWYKCILPLIAVIAAIALDAIFSLHEATRNSILFSLIFSFRYFRLVVNSIAFLLYKPIAISDSPTLTAKNVTVIIPTVQPYGRDFHKCIHSVHANGPAKIIIVTAGPGNHKRATKNTRIYPNVRVMNCNAQNKRRQVSMAIREVKTDFIVLCDDHVFWPSSAFLPSILAPFQDPAVGCVGTNKRVHRTTGFWNFLGCLYLERHNFEIAASTTIDGGVFVISGRTSAHRTNILNNQPFLTAFTNEYIDTWFGKIGRLNADDDNFITRWMIEHDWKLRIQYSKDARIETTLGTYPKFLSQCERWARTTWRSNPRSLLSRKVWETHPWCIYAVHLTSLFNFALLTDIALLYTLPGQRCIFDPSGRLVALLLWILGSKLVKTVPHFWLHPGDVGYLVGYILFGYVHSGIKFWAMLTFWNIEWGSRPLT